MMKGRILTLVVLFFLLPLLCAPTIGAQRYSIKPGGSYVVQVKVEKPSFLRLMESAWEVRAYFYDGINCYNAGHWTPLGIYDGWYKYRHWRDDWTGADEQRTVRITVRIVDYPRPPEDRMDEIPVGGTVKFRIRTIIYLDAEPVLSVPGEAEAGAIYFTIGGIRFHYPFTRAFDDYLIRGERFEGRINLSAAGKWRLIVDKDLMASVREEAREIDVFIIPDSIELNLMPAARLEDAYVLPFEVKVIAGIITIMVVAGVIAYMVLKKRGEEELFLE
jgi:hypothetical protein